MPDGHDETQKPNAFLDQLKLILTELKKSMEEKETLINNLNTEKGRLELIANMATGLAAAKEKATDLYEKTTSQNKATQESLKKTFDTFIKIANSVFKRQLESIFFSPTSPISAMGDFDKALTTIDDISSTITKTKIVTMPQLEDLSKKLDEAENNFSYQKKRFEDNKEEFKKAMKMNPDNKSDIEHDISNIRKATDKINASRKIIDLAKASLTPQATVASLNLSENNQEAPEFNQMATTAQSDFVNYDNAEAEDIAEDINQIISEIRLATETDEIIHTTNHTPEAYLTSTASDSTSAAKPRATIKQTQEEQAYNTKAALLEASLSVISTSTIQDLATTNFTAIINEVISHLDDLIQLSSSTTPVAQATGVHLEVTDAATPTTIADRTEKYKEQVRQQTQKLLDVASVKQNLIFVYRDAPAVSINTLAPNLALQAKVDEYNRLTSELGLAQGHAGAVSTILLLMRISDSDKLAEIQQIDAQTALAVVQLEVRLDSEYAEASLLKFKHLKDHVDGVAVISPQDRTDNKTRSDDLLTRINAQVEDSRNRIASVKNRIPAGSNLNKVDNDRIANLDRQLSEAQAYHAAITKRLAKKGNMFMAINDSLDRVFSVDLLKASTVAGKDPLKNLPAGKGTFLAVAQMHPVPVSYQKVQLDPGDVIRSSAVFANGTTGILVQDHTGTVTDKTPPSTKLAPQDQAVLALKQAKMLMDNYDPTKGDIVIRGGEKNAAQARRVYAAMLYLQRENPSFKDIKIKCHVPGCQLDDKFYQSKASVKDDFIRENFETPLAGGASAKPDPILAAEVKKTGEEVGTSVISRAARRNDFKDKYDAIVKKEGKTSPNLKPLEDKFTVKEGESLDQGANKGPSVK